LVSMLDPKVYSWSVVLSRWVAMGSQARETTATTTNKLVDLNAFSKCKFFKSVCGS